MTLVSEDLVVEREVVGGDVLDAGLPLEAPMRPAYASGALLQVLLVYLARPEGLDRPFEFAVRGRCEGIRDWLTWPSRSPLPNYRKTHAHCGCGAVGRFLRCSRRGMTQPALYRARGRRLNAAPPFHACEAADAASSGRGLAAGRMLACQPCLSATFSSRRARRTLSHCRRSSCSAPLQACLRMPGRGS